MLWAFCRSATDFLQADLAPKVTRNKDSAFYALHLGGIFVLVGIVRFSTEIAPFTCHWRNTHFGDRPIRIKTQSINLPMAANGDIVVNRSVIFKLTSKKRTLPSKLRLWL